ncbi:hypothetical protein N7513_002843 [Penicillium frequentans]|nr:hypothetical protein N7513_002843 [Penicillium glabrum]
MRDSESQNRQSHVDPEESPKNDVLHPPKRPKRAKYASKACTQCKRRKIKCDGDAPCRSCIAKGKKCERTGTDMRGKWRNTDRTSGSGDEVSSTLKEFELRMSPIRDPECHPHRTSEGQSNLDRPEAQREVTDLRAGRTSRSDPCYHSTQVPTFSGETSITHNLTVVESRLEQMGVQYARLQPTSPNREFRSCLTPSPDNSARQHTETRTNILNQVLTAHGLVPNREQWDGLLRTFCDEVHVLVPFLHLQSLWELHEKIWKTSFEIQPRNSNQYRNGVVRVEHAHILLCLANGRCVESSRFEGDEGRYSAGWSLYNAARDMFGDLLDGFTQCADQIFVLQTVLLMVIYLFRIDAHGSAEKVLALLISHSHHLGLHRNRVVESMTPFKSEMSRRLWWCQYIMDRRLAIETGRPFLIQDVNVDVGLPRNVDDEWLTRSQSTPRKHRSEQSTNEPEMVPVPYLIAMASYSKVVGKVWEALYGATTSESTPSPLLNEYLEHLINQSQKAIHPEFTYDPRNPKRVPTDGVPWWKIKQMFIMRIRWSSLYLLIRKPMLQKPWTPNQPIPEAIENEIICMRVAQSVFDDFNGMPEQHPKYTFPFLHYVTNATIIALGLIIKQPSFKRAYGQLTLRATRSLWDHCRKTWVSGKMARTVWKLNQMADATLSHPSERLQGRVGELRPNRDQFVLNEASHSPSPIVSGSESSPRMRPNGGDPGLTNHAIYRRKGHRNIQSVNGPSAARTNDFNGFDEPITPGFGFGQQCPIPNASNVRDSERAQLVENTQHKRAEPISDTHVVSEASVPNIRSHFEMTRPHPYSSETVQPGQDELDVDLSLPGEMIDGGMEWLQSLFVNGLDTHLPPVWD